MGDERGKSPVAAYAVDSRRAACHRHHKFPRQYLSAKAGGRGQETGGKLPCATARDQSGKGFKTPTKFSIWWLPVQGGATPI
ncbi:hypothetical protein A6S26_22520 [Nostoc sp. ATCC 43529]|nr:hypothetical protein A6S26_22520 [Nostoc sp. ATCC 43529]